MASRLDRGRVVYVCVCVWGGGTSTRLTVVSGNGCGHKNKSILLTNASVVSTCASSVTYCFMTFPHCDIHLYGTHNYWFKTLLIVISQDYIILGVAGL